MILPIVVACVLLALLVVIANHLVENRQVMIRRVGVQLTLMAILLVSLFISARYWIIYGVSCVPDCVGRNLLGRDFSQGILRNSNFTEANLRGADLSEADLYNADFSGANLDGVNLQNANLRGVRFVGASLVKADLRGALLGDTDFRGANLNDTDFTQANLTQVYLQGVTLAGAKLVEADLRSKNLAGVVFTAADLTDANLSSANLYGSQLSRANLSGAVMRAANLAGSWLNLTNLTGVDLTGSNLAGASFIGANLASAQLSGSRLVGATLIGAHMNGANLLNADLAGVRLLANELIPTDLLTDPNLKQLNELQLSQVIADVDLAGVSFNRQTKWPIGNASTLTSLLGQQFLNYNTTPANASNDASATNQPTIAVIGNPTLMPLTQGIVALFEQAGYTQTIFLDNVDLAVAFDTFCQPGSNGTLVMSHRLITSEERQRCRTNRRLATSLLVGQQALVVVVNAQNAFLTNATIADLNIIALADRWSDVNVDWPREEITRYVPDVQSVSFSFWAERIFGANFAAAEGAVRTIPTANGAQLIQGIGLDPYAIGVVDYGLYQQNASVLKPLTLDGIMPNSASVDEGSYPLAQPLYLYFDATAVRQTATLRAFLSFYVAQIDQVAGQVGLFPPPAATVQKNKETIQRLGQ
ncbi:MAG: hypothetical protein DYG89_27215 [Caldilinea sp. CFX5]|nr:hypothetical protein [Caldilinea sp. CFX5]